MGNEETEKSREEAKDMLNGVGGLNVWCSLVVHPDKSRKPPWKKRDEVEIKMARKREILVSMISQGKKKKLGQQTLMTSDYKLVCFSLNEYG